jgi:hypothetical protein
MTAVVKLSSFRLWPTSINRNLRSDGVFDLSIRGDLWEGMKEHKVVDEWQAVRTEFLWPIIGRTPSSRRKVTWRCEMLELQNVGSEAAS